MITINDYLPEFISLDSRFDVSLPWLQGPCDCCKSKYDENVQGYDKPICERCVYALHHVSEHPHHIVRFLTMTDSMNSIAACRMRFINTLNEIVNESRQHRPSNVESSARYFVSLIEETEVCFETVVPLSRVAYLFESRQFISTHNLENTIFNYASNLVRSKCISTERYYDILRETNIRT